MKKLFRKLKEKKDEARATGPESGSTAPSRQQAPPAAGLPTRVPHARVAPPSQVCQVCYQLDPNQSPGDGNPSEGDASWAMLEYDIPAETPVGKVQIEKTETLIHSAQRGCMHCFTIHSALAAVHPGWEAEETIVHIFLASGLPVIVRLEFGKTTSEVLGREAVRRLGHELPESANGMRFHFTLVDPSKPAIELEVYRPRLPADQNIAGDQALSPLVSQMGFSDNIPGHSGDERCFEFITEKVEHCLREHGCGGHGNPPLLPDRVVWIEADNATRIQLIEPQDVRAKYITLSYCWGPVSDDTFLTDAGTLNAKKAGISHNDLPPLIQDVVRCARALGIEYIWVDRLCIVQGDNGDFRTQAPKMGEIYGNATLTIAAASAGSENDRILVERDARWIPFSLEVNSHGLGNLTLRIRRRTHSLGREKHGGDYGKVSTRAWIWQERLLSSRTVFYTQHALKFECHCHSVWEGFDHGVVGHSWSSQLEHTSNLSWLRLVEEFMKRDITKASDRLPAIDAVMRRIAKSTGWSPFWGVWAESLIESLAWVPDDRDTTMPHACRMNPDRYAPTWSWASLEGPISYRSVSPTPVFDRTDPLVYELKYRDADAASGAITITGRYVIGGIRASTENDEGDDSSSSHGNGPQRVRYDMVYSGEHPECRIDPDVALMPWGGERDQPHTASVVRLPYGKTPLATPWTGHCVCMLLGRRKYKTLILLLGAAQGQSDVWERIGTAHGIPSSRFSTAERGEFRIV